MDSLSTGLSSGIIVQPSGMRIPSPTQSAKMGAIYNTNSPNISGLGYTKQSTSINPTDTRLATTGLDVGGMPKMPPKPSVMSDSASLARALAKRDATDAYASGQADVSGLAAAEAAMGEQIITAADSDWRIRLSVAPLATYLYKDPSNYLMAPLIPTSGVIFPLTPRITLTHSATYETTSPTHSNYPIHTYTHSRVTNFVVSGEFTVQTQAEADYFLATILFFRSATKMFWGQEPAAGSPPPVLFLDGYGDHYFPHVPVIVKSFVNDISDETDFVEAYVGKTRVPTTSIISLTLEPVYSRKKIHEEFTFDKYSKGELSGIASGGFI